MELLSFIFKEDVDAVGLSKYKDDKDDISSFIEQNFNIHKKYFEPDYSNNFFLL